MSTNAKTEKVEWSAAGLTNSLNEHVQALRPSVNPSPKKKQLSAAQRMSTAVNSMMGVVRTSLAVTKSAEAKPNMSFMELK